MKKFLLLISLTFLFTNTKAQLYGALGFENNPLNPQSYSFGCIYKATGAVNNFTGLKEFKVTHDGTNPVLTGLVLGPNNLIYGVTNGSVANGGGSMFYTYDPVNDIYTPFQYLTSSNATALGSNANSSPILHSNGKFYGTTSQGGTNNLGVIYEIDPTTNQYTKLFDIPGNTDGAEPKYGVVEGPDHKLWGICRYQGNNSTGTIFSYDIASSTFTTAFAFPTTLDASYSRLPNISSSGILYIPIGSSTLNGTLFAYDIYSGDTLSLHQFQSSTGYDPTGKIYIHGDTLIGVCHQGGAANRGNIYGIDLTDSSYFIIYDFSNSGPQSPFINSEMILGPTGKLYFNIGSSNVYNSFLLELDLSSWNLSSIYEFAGSTSYPYLATRPLFYNSDTVYFTGGTGIMWKGEFSQYSFSSNSYERIFSFSETRDGATPLGYMFIGSDGKLTGNAQKGGRFDNGTIFKYDLTSSTFEVVKEINIGYAGIMNSGIAEGAPGIYYGHYRNGSFQTAFYEYNSMTDIVREIHLSPSNESNYCPFKANDGKIYGAYQMGGNGYGYVYCYDPIVDTFMIIHNFNGADGAEPLAKFMQTEDGIIYGSTSSGGTNNKGTLFSISPYTMQVIVHTNYSSGVDAYLFNTLTSSGGLLYGVCHNSGINSIGNILVFDPGNNYSATTLYSLSGTPNGKFPVGKPWFDNSNNLLFTCRDGGTYAKGTLVKYNFSGGSLSKMYDFNSTPLGDVPVGDMHYNCSGEATISDVNQVIHVCPGDNITLHTNATGTSLQYRWYKDGVPIGTGVLPDLDLTNIQVSDGGYYHCTVSNSCGIKLRPMIELAVDCNGIDENNPNDLIKITRYDEGRFSINCNEVCEVKILDLNGRLVYTTQQTDILHYYQPQLNAGIYFIQVNTKSGVNKVEKIVTLSH